jgi:hypothetical protein
MCHLRGILMLKLNRGDQAKLCFMESLTLDVKCYDAFSQLISGEMMTPDEGWCYVVVISLQNLIFFDTRVGICTGSCVQRADQRGCGLHPINVYFSSAEA